MIRNRKVLCLDWDKRSLRLVVARVGKGRTVLEDAHSHRLPPTVDADEPEQMGDFIRSMLKRHRLSHRTVVVDVPRERAVINRLTLAPTPPAEVAAAVRFQAMKELPFSIETAAIDYVELSRDEAGRVTEVLLAAVTLETLDRVRLTCEAAGLAPARIGLRPYANLLSARQMRGAADKRLLFVDVGPGATEIDVFRGALLAFARSANVNVPLPAADGTVREDSRVISLAEISELIGSDEAVDAAVGELLVEVTRTIQAYRATEAEGVIDEVIVAGGTGIETHLADRLGQRLGLSVTLFDPTEALALPAGEAVKLRSFSAALGLAWGMGREGSLALDFLNPKRPVSSREALQKRVRVMGLAAALLLVLVGGVLGLQYHGLKRERDGLRKANNVLVKQVEEKLKIQERIEQAQEWAMQAVWPDEFLNVTQLALEPGVPPGEKLVVQEISFDMVSRTPGVTLRNVYATDWQVPTDFVRRLNEGEGEGERLYDAAQMSWTEIKDGQKFKGKTDVRISLRKLQEFREQTAKRLKERKDRLRNVGRK